ncbi:hypothetical protein SAMN05878281_3523 [Salegentibacter salegens]|uniref:Uncharacterized protein n=1 Tax=Salegentibacter salegens TaxID=143223 RepID=A0A1M7NX45_9FLAO|nr:hypothetical protein LY58_03268 [Salegentibacter salegens]SHN08666.1 hypothetical protein SAMN05878281_3523 [Salegentibacter salegens]
MKKRKGSGKFFRAFFYGFFEKLFGFYRLSFISKYQLIIKFIYENNAVGVLAQLCLLLLPGVPPGEENFSFSFHWWLSPTLADLQI